MNQQSRKEVMMFTKIRARVVVPILAVLVVAWQLIIPLGVSASTGQQGGQSGTLRVYKTTIPAGDQTRFPITVVTSNGMVHGNASSTIGDSEYVDFSVSEGTYRVIESLPNGWSQTKNSCWDVVVNANNPHQTCGIENVKGAKLNIKKDASPSSEQDFTFTSAKLGTFTLDDDANHVLADNKQFTLLPAGTYTITEQQVAGWNLDSITCQGTQNYTIDRAAGTLEITLGVGDDVACEFSNTQRAAVAGASSNPTVPQVLGASTTTTTTPAQLAETGAPVAMQVLAGAAILSIVGAIHLLNRRKQHAS